MAAPGPVRLSGVGSLLVTPQQSYDNTSITPALAPSISIPASFRISQTRPSPASTRPSRICAVSTGPSREKVGFHSRQTQHPMARRAKFRWRIAMLALYDLPLPGARVLAR